jgi:hypothetical protein
VGVFREIGLWENPGAPDLPEVSGFIDEDQESFDRNEIAARLEAGARTDRAYMGYSTCRICGAQNGSGEKTDGRFIWPEGLAHYVWAHRVRLPDEVAMNIGYARDADPDELDRAVNATNDERSRTWCCSLTMG